MDIHDISRYVKLCQRAERPGSSGPSTEEKTVRTALAEMELKHPGIAAAALRAERAIAGEETKPPPQPSWMGVVETVLGSVASKASSQFADELSGHMSGAARFEPLQKRHCKITPHQCAPEQVCIEVRMNADDVSRPQVLARILEAVGDRLQSEALGRG